MGGMKNPGAGVGVAALTLTLEAENTAHWKTRFDKNCCILANLVAGANTGLALIVTGLLAAVIITAVCSYKWVAKYCR
jgi:type IV secretory pathway TrbD component